jgi:cysteine synthase
MLMNMSHGTASAVLDIYRARLVPLSENLTAAVFPLMKIFPAAFCLRRAAEDGLINSKSLVIETSSGNMALGLAIACRSYGYRLTIVTDYACDDNLCRRMSDIGTTVEVVPRPSESGSYQRARLDKLDELRSQVQNHWWLNQYDNSGNPGSYSNFASELVESLGQIDCLVGAVGSGGSVCGTASYLRTLFPEMHTIGVDTFGSVLFGHPDGHRELRGLGNSLLPGNLDHSIFDEVHWVTAAEAYTATRILHQETCLFCGGTSGAAWLVAAEWARQHPQKRVVCIFPDDGYRYMQTIYNNEFMTERKLWLHKLPVSPQRVEHPSHAASSAWACMDWGRRKYQEIMNPAIVMADSR